MPRHFRRWQAARRQAKRRQDLRVRAQHAQAQKERGGRAKVIAQSAREPRSYSHVVTQPFVFPPFMRSAGSTNTP